MDINNICFIFTRNRFNQVLMFETREKAKRWAQKATTWSDDEINRQIRGTFNHGDFISTAAPIDDE